MTTDIPGKITWAGRVLSYEGTRLDIDRLADMVHGLAAELNRTIRSLLHVTTTTDEAGQPSEIPDVCLDEIFDDASCSEVGYYFLRDPRNTWAPQGRTWLIQRILADADLAGHWVEGPGPAVVAVVAAVAAVAAVAVVAAMAPRARRRRR